ncbi:MAG: hypothetical protein E7539_03190 [Ruminococcaceae bacterium]|nr:hypothetical protein [Oscillospiraceae bacterium]
MVTIKNNTERDIIAFNDHFSVEIKGRQYAEIPDDVLNKDSVFYFKYSSFEGVKRNVVKKLGNGLRLLRDAEVEIQNLFPLVTVLDLDGITNFSLQEKIIKLRNFFKGIIPTKTVYLHRILCKKGYDEFVDDCLFLNRYDKTTFLKIMRNSNIVNCVTIFVLLCALIFSFIKKYTFSDGIVIFFLLFLLSIIAFAIKEMYYTKKAKKWKVLEDTGERPRDGSES